MLLAEMGYGLDLSKCAATGTVNDLIYVSPKSGRAVSRAAGEQWASKLFFLPHFLINNDAKAKNFHEIEQGLKLTEYFLEKWLAPTLNIKALPESRNRFVLSLDD